MSKNSLAKALETEIAARFAKEGWRRERVAKLQPAFVRNSDVTPYFLDRVLSRHGKYLMAEGWVGVIHRGFEERWIRENASAATRNRFVLIRNVLNFDRLRPLVYIEMNEVETAGSQLCNELLLVLEALSQSEAELRLALENGDLAGVPVQKFVLPGGETKLASLKSFVAANSRYFGGDS